MRKSKVDRATFLKKDVKVLAMKLSELHKGQVAKITGIQSDPTTTARLQHHGLCAGQIVKLVRVAPFGGPLLLQDVHTGAQIVTARSIAAEIEIGIEEEKSE